MSGISKKIVERCEGMGDYRRGVLKQFAISGFSLPFPKNLILRFLPLILLPFLLSVIDNSWTFLTPNGFIDSYLYTGYFLDVQHHVRAFGQTYYGSRLPWILVGQLAYILASPEIANLLLRFFLFYLGTFSLYIAVRATWKNHSAALLSAVLLGVNTHFLQAIHWDYVDGPALTTLLVSFACLAVSTGSKRRAPLLIASGFSAAIALSIHIFIVLLLPALGLWYAWTHAGTPRRRFLGGIAFVFCGALIAFVLFGSINKSLGLDFNYLQSQVDIARSVDTSPWRLSDWKWVEYATWLAAPFTAVLFSVVVILVVLTRRRRNLPLDPEVEMLAPAGLAVLVTTALFLSIELTKGLALQQSFYASFLIPYTFLALGGGISVSLSRLTPSGRLNIGVMLATLTLLIGSFVAASFHALPGCTSGCSFFSPMGLVLVLAAAGIGVSIASRNGLVLVFTIALMAIVNSIPNDYVLVRKQRDTMHARFLMVYDANTALEPYNRDGQLRFWYDRDETLGPTFLGIASLQLWGFRLISDSFPGLTNPLSGNEASVSGLTIALLTEDDDALSKADKTLKLNAQRSELVFHDRILRGDQAFNIFVIKAVPLGSSVE